MRWTSSTFLTFTVLLGIYSTHAFPLASRAAKSDESKDAAAPVYPEHNLSTPINHFPDDNDRYSPHDDGQFNMRYWYDDQFYQENGPLIILSSGETSGANRLPYLEKGIVNILAKATNGIGIILEHRYYGTSQPFDNLSSDNLRFLSTEQAMADIAFFSEKVEFDNIDKSKIGPTILYGGSYAGGLVAFTKQKYPDQIFGAIASSGVVTAIIDFWQYYEPIRLNAPQNCSDTIVDLVDKMDYLVSIDDENLTQDLKDTFGLGQVDDIRDFFSAIGSPVASWQSLNWDPAVGSNTFYEFCGNLTSANENDLDYKYSNYTDGEPWKNFGNYVDYFKSTVLATCIQDNQSQEDCFGTSNTTKYQQDSLTTLSEDELDMRAWTYQVCTEWGYYQGGAPVGHPSLTSRYIDVDYFQRQCDYYFGDAQYHKIPETVPVDVINQYGGFDIAGDYIAFIDGSADPWLYATVKSPLSPNGGVREDTDLRPNYLIPGGGHHWDENGVNSTDPITTPDFIQQAHDREVEFVTSWINDWKKSKGQ